MSVPANVQTDFEPKKFWATLKLWPNEIERRAVQYWWVVLLVPFLGLVAWGVTIAPFLQLRPAAGSFLIVQDPYMSSLLAALLLSGLAFRIWERMIRETFGNLVDSGVVPNTPGSLMRFEIHSNRLCSLLSKKWRYFMSFLFVGFVLAANWYQLEKLQNSIWDPSTPTYIVLFRALTLLTFLGWGYGIGAVGWCLLAVARWIAVIPREMKIDVRPGHPDACGGLGSIGKCCFQAITPLLIGMVLALLWSYSPHLTFFNKIYDKSFFTIIVPASQSLILVLLLLAACLAVLPLRGLHRMMRTFRLTREREYMQRLSAALDEVDRVLISGDAIAVKEAHEKLKLAQQLDPVTLKISEWPFDRGVVVKYGVTPLVSILASFGKEALSLFKP